LVLSFLIQIRIFAPIHPHQLPGKFQILSWKQNNSFTQSPLTYGKPETSAHQEILNFISDNHPPAVQSYLPCMGFLEITHFGFCSSDQPIHHQSNQNDRVITTKWKIPNSNAMVRILSELSDKLTAKAPGSQGAAWN
jgi:hypothetical protein